MSETATRTDTGTGVELPDWTAGMVAGILGGIVMGVLYSLFQPEFLRDAIPGIYGLQGGLVGWFLHVSHAAILGVAFAFVIDVANGGDWSLGETALTGVTFAVGVWLLLAMFVVPLGTWLFGGEAGLSLPDLTIVGAIAHLAYGLVTGATFASLD